MLGRRSLLARSAVVAAAVTGCGPLARRQPQVLEFWGGPNGEQRQDQVDAWNARRPQLRVHFSAVSATGQGVAALRRFAAAVAARTAPQVVDFDRFQIATYVNWHMFRPLDAYARRDRFDLGRFAPAAMPEAIGFDRQLYGLPSSVDNRLLYWNKEQIEAAGLDPDRPPATWEELRRYAGRLTRRGGSIGLERIGLHTEEGQASLHGFAWQNGGGFQTPDGRTATLPLAPNQEALQWMVDLMQDQGGWAAARAFRESWDTEARHAFLTGQVAMQYQIADWAGGLIAKYRPEMSFGVAPPPVRRAGEPPLSWSGGYSYVLGRGALDADAGWELIKWLVGAEAWTVAYEGELARVRAVGGVFLPGMTGQPALDQEMYARYRTGLPQLDAVPEVAMRLMPHSRVRELSIAAADLWDGVTRAQAEAIAQTKSVRRALEDQNELVQRALDQAWVFAPR